MYACITQKADGSLCLCHPFKPLILPAGGQTEHFWHMKTRIDQSISYPTFLMAARRGLIRREWEQWVQLFAGGCGGGDLHNNAGMQAMCLWQQHENINTVRYSTIQYDNGAIWLTQHLVDPRSRCPWPWQQQQQPVYCRAVLLHSLILNSWLCFGGWHPVGGLLCLRVASFITDIKWGTEKGQEGWGGEYLQCRRKHTVFQCINVVYLPDSL